MTNKEILEKAIQKAIDGNWKDCPEKVDYVKVANYRYEDDFANGLRLITYVVSFPSGLGFSDKASVSEIIFNHDFAKALWGEEWNIPSPTGGRVVNGRNVVAKLQKGEPWQYHLQQMVIAENPIKYLGDNLD